jgi:tripartite-type tricarboxylate transporter receptor subunit TctC
VKRASRAGEPETTMSSALSRSLTAAMLAAATAAMAPAHAADEPFPSRTVTIIVPFAPGGSLDFTARVFAEKLKDVLRQTVVVANRPGATNTVAALALASAPPDGHTLLLTSGATWGHAHLLVRGFKMTVDDFIPVARVAVNNSIFAVNPKVPVNSLADLVKYSQAKPGGLSFCTTGTGSQNHLQLEMLRSLVRVKQPEQRFELTTVPYNGLAPAMTALRRGDVDVCVLPYASIVKELDGKELRIISIQAPKRLAQLPHVQTTGEQGYPELDQNESPVIFSVLKGTRPEVVRRIEAALKEVSQDPTVVKRLDDADLQPGFAGTAETTARVITDVARTSQAIRDAKLQAAP